MNRASLDEPVIGFDAREMWRLFDKTWDSKRKSTFLIREDLTKPLSTDVMIWPSIFDSQNSRMGYASNSNSTDSIPLVNAPKWIGPVQDHWDDLKKLNDWIIAASCPQQYWIVAVTLITSVLNQKELESWHRAGATTGLRNDGISPEFADRNWTFLGFDVSDAFLLSGLSDCGYDGQERQVLIKNYAGLLNDHHLFLEKTAADRFRIATNTRVKEHAPFFVYGLWRVV